MVGRRRPSRAAGLALALVAGAWSGPALPGAPTEYEVKAAYLYYLATFIEWPDDAFAAPTDPFVIGVLGEDPFGPTLDDTLKGKEVRGRRLVLKRFPSLTSDTRCQLLFVSASEERSLPRILKSVEGSSVLTVADMSHFADRGGHVALRLEDRRVRFSINLEAAQRAHLRVSAQLLKLATPPSSGGSATGT